MPVKGLYSSQILWEDEIQSWQEDSESEVAQLCPTLWDPMDCSLPGSSLHGIFQARTLEWVAISFSNMIPNLVHGIFIYLFIIFGCVVSLCLSERVMLETLSFLSSWSQALHVVIHTVNGVPLLD